MIRLRILVCLALLVPSGCAYEGTVVRKEYRPLPFRESLGQEAIYRFQLRGRDGQVRDRMVSADVFAGYEVGDYFNDLQSPLAPVSVSAEGPETPMAPLYWPRPLEEYGTHYRTMETASLAQYRTMETASVKRVASHPNNRTGQRGKTTSRHVASVKSNHRTTHRSRVASKQHTKHQVKVARKTKHKKHATKVAQAAS